MSQKSKGNNENLSSNKADSPKASSKTEDQASPSLSTSPSIVVKKLTKSFGDNHVLRGMDLVLYPGEVNFIIGRSGGGKSVLLKHLTGLMEPDSGEVWYGDMEFFKAKKKDREKLRKSIGLLFQDGALFDSLSAGENVSFPVWFHRSLAPKEAKERSLNLLNELGMKDSYDAKVSELSSGEKKRVAIARALIMEPKILFFDEPTTGLDPILSSQVDSLILEVRKRTMATVVVISHDIAATLTIADRVNLIHDGVVALSGVPDDFRKSDLSEVKEFILGTSLTGAAP
ncbi:MAG: ATP-binding cassette domain-containing protein, partial [Deltaproteobacteria bacterium]|nr:ATP-binding cassette domain-containing protein [Deltaproteobacteria bacterium]